MTFPSAKTTFSLRKKMKSVMIQHPLIDFERKKIRISTFYSTMIISATTAIKLTKENSGHYPSFW